MVEGIYTLYSMVHRGDYLYLFYNLLDKNMRQKTLSNLNKFFPSVFILVKIMNVNSQAQVK